VDIPATGHVEAGADPGEHRCVCDRLGAWGLAAWIGILFMIYVVYFAGAYFEWWEINDE
jgi:hypothetical protein